MKSIYNRAELVGMLERGLVILEDKGFTGDYIDYRLLVVENNGKKYEIYIR